MSGAIHILNVGAGDTTLSFDPKNPKECERAAGIVTDMIRRGYALLVEVGTKGGKPIFQRAEAFDPKTHEYIIAGGPDETITIGEEETPEKPRKPRKKKQQRLAAGKTRAVSVGRTAGG